MSYIIILLAILFCLVVIALCAIYVRCKHMILQQSRAYNARQQRNTRLCQTSPSRNATIATVCSQVQPKMPPPYEILPPPYNTVDDGTSEKNGNKIAFPDEPPPAYSPYDTGVF